jgi:hypothetical protein
MPFNAVLSEDSAMQIQKETKLFAFKLAEKKEKDAQPAAKWQVRDRRRLHLQRRSGKPARLA